MPFLKDHCTAIQITRSLQKREKRKFHTLLLWEINTGSAALYNKQTEIIIPKGTFTMHEALFHALCTYSHLVLRLFYEVGVVIKPVSQMRKLSHRLLK